MKYLESPTKDYRELGFRANTHRGSPLLIASRAVRTIIAHAIVITNKIFGGWKPMVFPTFVAYKPNLHNTIITQIKTNVKYELSTEKRVNHETN